MNTKYETKLDDTQAVSDYYTNAIIEFAGGDKSLEDYLLKHIKHDGNVYEQLEYLREQWQFGGYDQQDALEGNEDEQ